MTSTSRPSALASPGIRKIIAGAIVALGLLAVISRATSFSPQRIIANDFSQDYVAAKAFTAGQSMYQETFPLIKRYLQRDASQYGLVPPGQKDPHPPLFVLLAVPFTSLKYKVARAIWLLVMAGLLSLGVVLLCRELGMSRYWAIVAGIGSLALPVAQKDLLYAQANGLLLVLVVLAWRFERHGRQGPAGVCVGIAAALKLFPAFLALVFIRKREWRALAWSALSAVVLTLVSGGIAGFGVSRYFFTTVSKGNFEYWRSAPMNIPLVAVPFRWLTRSDWPTPSLNLPAIAVVLALLLFALCIFGALKTSGGLTGDPFLEALPWMLLATPIVWDAYLVLLLPAVFVVVKSAATRNRLPGIAVLVAIAFLAIGAPPGLAIPQLAHVPDQVFGYALPTYALLLFVGLSWRRVSDSPRTLIEPIASV